MCVCVYKSNSIDPIHPPSWQTSPTHDTEIFFKALKSYRSVPRTCGAFWRPQTVRSIISGRQNVTPNQPTVILETRGFIFNSSWKKSRFQTKSFLLPRSWLSISLFPYIFSEDSPLNEETCPGKVIFWRCTNLKFHRKRRNLRRKSIFIHLSCPLFSVFLFWRIESLMTREARKQHRR